MRFYFSFRAAIALAAVIAACTTAARSFAAVPTVPPSALQASVPARPAKDDAAVYLVALNSAGAANYSGGINGYAATRPIPGRRLDRHDGRVASYAHYLEEQHERMLQELGASSRKLYSYRYAFNGFAARLTPAEASRLARHPDVERVWADGEQRIQTNNSSVFLGLLDQNGGLRADLGLRGENIVIGVIDSGVATDHPALRDYEERLPDLCRSDWAESSWLGLFLCYRYKKNPIAVSVYDPPEHFHGICQSGDGFSETQCNNKVIGARYYLDGFLFRHQLDDAEFVSPRDADGHGTHIATILAGHSVPARLFGTRIAEISGIAPRARIAVYKACWLRPGATRATCATSDLARAIDDAVGDGVDIINYSLGSQETDLTAPDDLALLNALDAGVLSVVAAGNDGPNYYTIGSPSSAPWVLTVAASTQTGTHYEEAITILEPAHMSGRLPMREASFTKQLVDLAPIQSELTLADDGQNHLADGLPGSARDVCEPLINGPALAGHIALIERGGCDFQLKLERVEQAGAVGAVVYNRNGAPIVMNGAPGSVTIPAVMVSAAEGQRLVDALSLGDRVLLRLEKGEFVEYQSSGNVVSDFSSRGPSLSDWDFLKPDLTAPGVDILAGHTPDVANGIGGEYFQYLSGTSQSTPEAAGVAALIKEAHPDWSPSAIKSALMTTAYQSVSQPDSETLANPFEMGSGHIDANRAIDPGLIYEAGFFDHAAYLCGLENAPFPAGECDILALAGYPFAGRNLNLPSIAVGELITGDAITRRVTNVGPPGRYDVTVNAPFGIDIVVDPPSLNLSTGESAQYTVSFIVGPEAEREAWSFGRLNWSDGERNVGSPIAVQSVLLRAPQEIALSGTAGNGSFPIDFGYSGGFFAGVHGLHAPFYREQSSVAEDSSNRFSFRFDNGVNGHYFNVEPGDLFLRVSLFDEHTDGNDDLDLYLFYCTTPANCTQVGQSGSFTSTEEIDLLQPLPGLYAALVHGFETDPVNGGPGANYELFAWSFARGDDAGNLALQAPPTVTDGERLDLGYEWDGLDGSNRYLGAISHNTPFDLFFLSIVTANTF